MATKKSPLARIKEQFGDKEKLVDAVLVVVPGADDRDAFRTKLLAVSNKKLLRMLEVGSEIRKKYALTLAGVLAWVPTRPWSST